jgi:hypothetical protein
MRAVAALALVAATLAVPTASLAAPTRIVETTPFTAAGALRSGLIVEDRFDGDCYAGSSRVAAGYTCSAEHYVFDPCWKDPGAARFICQYAPWRRRVSRIDVDTVPDPPEEETSNSGWAPWGIRLASGRRCVSLRGAVDRFDGHYLSYRCGGTLHLVDMVDRSHARWRIRTARYHRATGYTLGRWRVIATGYFGRP